MFGFLKKTPAPGPSYAEVDSREKAQALVASGQLVRVLMMPAAFGGADIESNAVYLPPFAAEFKQRTDMNIVKPLVQDGTVSRYEVLPVYEGNSFVPVAITVKASDPGSFTQVIRVWGGDLPEA